MSNVQIFDIAVDKFINSDWLRGGGNTEGDAFDTSRCVWIAIADAYMETDAGRYLQASKDDLLVSTLIAAINAIDPGWEGKLAEDSDKTLQQIFEWNDQRATSKDQVTEVLRMAKEIASAQV